jgi:hypothetical protein
MFPPHFSFFRKEGVLSVCLHSTSKPGDFHRTWYEHYALGRHPSTILLNFPQSIITAQQTRELEK